MDYLNLWRALNNSGAGFPVGAPGDHVDRVAELGDVIVPAHHTGGVAVYAADDGGAVLVRNVHGPWAVRIPALVFSAYDAYDNGACVEKTQLWPEFAGTFAPSMDAAVGVAEVDWYETTHVVVEALDPWGDVKDRRTIHVAEQYEDDDGYVWFAALEDGPV